MDCSSHMQWLVERDNGVRRQTDKGPPRDQHVSERQDNTLHYHERTQAYITGVDARACLI